MLRTFALTVCILLSAGVSPALAWGCEVHQAIAFVAERLLSPPTIRSIEAILRAAPSNSSLDRFCRPVMTDAIADASTWADDYRTLVPATGGWHFINLPLTGGAATQSYGRFCPGGNCIIEAIVTQYRNLTAGSDARTRADALRFLIHLVGDVHQPMHTTSNGDRGGNCFPVTFLGEEPREDEQHNFRPNLHQVWDASLIRHFMNTRRITGSRALAEYVIANAPLPTVRAQAPMTSNVMEWVRESNTLARTVVYGRLPVTPPIALPGPLVLRSCDDDSRVARRLARLHERIDEKYVNASIPAVVSQIRLAGTRLAAALEAAVSTAEASQRDGRALVPRRATRQTP